MQKKFFYLEKTVIYTYPDTYTNIRVDCTTQNVLLRRLSANWDESCRFIARTLLIPRKFKINSFDTSVIRSDSWKIIDLTAQGYEQSVLIWKYEWKYIAHSPSCTTLSASEKRSSAAHADSESICIIRHYSIALQIIDVTYDVKPSVVQYPVKVERSRRLTLQAKLQVHWRDSLLCTTGALSINLFVNFQVKLIVPTVHCNSTKLKGSVQSSVYIFY